jgi:N-acetylmuramoyl-L-alanine amidase
VPSILVETAFISNPAEERKLRDPAHQKLLANAVMSGVKGYFESTPPPGTWFAAQAAKRNGMRVASMAGSKSSASSDMHKVGRGESLSSIARQYGVSVGALKSANQMDSNTVRAGAVLTIPAG